jgi:hypothetical protein
LLFNRTRRLRRFPKGSSCISGVTFIPKKQLFFTLDFLKPHTSTEGSRVQGGEWGSEGVMIETASALFQKEKEPLIICTHLHCNSNIYKLHYNFSHCSFFTLSKQLSLFLSIGDGQRRR